MMNDVPLVLVDSYAQIYRGYYAVRALTSPSGAPSNAVFAFSKFISRLDKDQAGADGAFIFDLGRPAHRMALAPDYKANRPPMPEELRSQLPAVRELMQAFGWPVIEAEGFEADDLIAAIALKFKASREVRIVTGDKDLFQLVDSNVSILAPDKEGGLSKRGAAETVEKFGVPPERVSDLLALTGDSSDNIKGVDGVGPKTAASLLNEFGSLDALLANSSSIKRETVRAKIEASKELILRNVKLVKLGLASPEGVDWTPEKFKRSAPDREKLLKIASDYGLKSLLKELEGGSSKPKAASVKIVETPKPSNPEPEQLTLF